MPGISELLSTAKDQIEDAAAGGDPLTVALEHAARSLPAVKD